MELEIERKGLAKLTDEASNLDLKIAALQELMRLRDILNQIEELEKTLLDEDESLKSKFDEVKQAILNGVVRIENAMNDNEIDAALTSVKSILEELRADIAQTQERQQSVKKRLSMRSAPSAIPPAERRKILKKIFPKTLQLTRTKNVVQPEIGEEDIFITAPLEKLRFVYTLSDSIKLMIGHLYFNSIQYYFSEELGIITLYMKLAVLLVLAALFLAMWYGYRLIKI